RDPREPPAAGRVRPRARGAAPLPGRPGGTHPRRRMSGSPAGLEDVQEPLRWPDSVLPAPSGADHLVALDVDGTLMTEDGFISPEAKALVREIRAAGSHVVLATGRPLVALLPVADELGLDDGYLVASNGSVTARLGGPQGYEIDDAVMFEAGPALDLVL